MRNYLILLVLLATPGLAQAYVGPGLGAGTIGVILGILASIFLALFAIFWYPLKRLLRGRKNSRKQPADDGQQPKKDAPADSGSGH